jgi:hypothetical protein
MTTSHANTSFPGDNNRGAQFGSVVGNVSLNFVDRGGASVMASGVVIRTLMECLATVESLEPRPNPSSTVPFYHDPDFVDRGDILAQIDQKCSAPASRTALVGLGGVG